MNFKQNKHASMIVGLTGSIGCGKSAVAAIMAKLGATIIDTDILARDLVQPGSAALATIVATFGSDILNADGTLNRAAMAKLVFSNEDKRKALESILHPAISVSLTTQINAAKAASPRPELIVCVIPLLFESGMHKESFEKTITVSAPESLCIQRSMQRDGSNEDMVRQRLKCQMSQKEKESLADFVILNDGTLHELEIKVQNLYTDLLKNRETKWKYPK